MHVARITGQEADDAYAAWGCNCGPCAIAAIMGMSLTAVRPYMGDFESKHYTNPTLMWETLDRIGRPWRKVGKSWPRFGLARIQWEGPWTEPGVPMKARYRQTHWVASWITTERGHGVFDVNATGNGSGHGVFDVNATGNGTGWCSFEHWRDVLVPHIITHVPRANGKWHVTHGVEVEPLAMRRI